MRTSVLACGLTLIWAVFLALAVLHPGLATASDLSRTESFDSACDQPAHEEINIDRKPGGGWLTRGGDTIPAKSGVLEIRGGIPSVGIQIDFGATTFLQIGLHASYIYLWSLNFGTDDFSLINAYNAGLIVKFNLFRFNGHAVSLGIDNSVTIEINEYGYRLPAFTFLAPEIRYSYRWNRPDVAVIGGFRFPFILFEGGIDLPALIIAGFEAKLARRVSLHVIAEYGLSYSRGGEQDNVDISNAFGAEVGLSVLLW